MILCLLPVTRHFSTFLKIDPREIGYEDGKLMELVEGCAQRWAVVLTVLKFKVFLSED